MCVSKAGVEACTSRRVMFVDGSLGFVGRSATAI